MAYKAAQLKIDLGKTDLENATGRTTIVYGNSTAGKTSNLVEAAKYLAEKTKKKIRLVSYEDSSKTSFLPLMAEGLVQALFLTKTDDPAGILGKLSRGEWINKEGEFVPYDGSAGGYIIEGISSASEAIQEYHRKHKLFLGEQGDQAHTTESGEILALPGQFSYNQTTLEIISAIKGFASIAGVDRVLWSAHEGKGVEVTHSVINPKTGRPENQGGNIMGPLVTGASATAKVMPLCGMLLHFDILTDKDGNSERRIYMQTHKDPKVIGWSSPAKVTLPVSMQAEFYKRLGATPERYIVPTINTNRGILINSLADVLRVEDELMNELYSKLG